jgi:hypothetical protein
MRKVDFKDIEKAIASTKATFGPTPDEKVVFANYTERALAGNFIKKPMLIGNTNYEAGLVRTLYDLGGVVASADHWLQFDDLIFNCPAAVRANISISYGIPTWRYRWFGAFPNTELTAVPWSGAWHASEVAILFDNSPTVVPNTPEEIAIGKFIRGAWSTFAKDPEKGLSSYGDGWPIYDPGNDTLAMLAWGNTTGLNLIRGNIFDGFCGSYAPLYAVTATTATGTPTASATSTSSTASSSAAPANSSAIAALVAQIPSCAQGPLATAIQGAGCGLTDYACQCGTAKTAITANASAPILQACGTTTALQVQDLTNKICDAAVSSSPTATGGTASGATTTSGAPASTVTISPAAAASIGALVATIPPCALTPLTSAITAAGCALTDYVCQCTTGKDAITAGASGGILQSCGADKGAQVTTITDNICAIVGVKPATKTTSTGRAPGNEATDIQGVLATATPGQCISAVKACEGTGIDVNKLLLAALVGLGGLFML